MKLKLGQWLRRLATRLDDRPTMDWPTGTDVHILNAPGRQVVTLTNPSLNHINYTKLGSGKVTYVANGGGGGGGVL